MTRKIIITAFSSLDGVVEDPAWTFPYWNDEIAAFKAKETDRGQELLLGRVTYEQFAQAWPQAEDEGAAYFNGARKHVVTSTLKKDIWANASFVGGDLAGEIARLKGADGPDLVVHGSITLARFLITHGLVDELRLLVYPVVLGTGRRLLDDGVKATLALASAKPLQKGVVALTYHPAEEPQ